MEGESSWIRKTNYSHTVCHRLDSSRLASASFSMQRDENPGLKSRPKSASFHQSSEPKTTDQIMRKSGKQRSFSPVPNTPVSDAFKEARSGLKRFSTPHPRRKEFSGKDVVGNSFHKYANGTGNFLRQFSSIKFHDKTKSQKESSWTKYFDLVGGKVNGEETSDEWMVDLSKLFLGLRFAYGAHSRLHHGVYKDEPVAVKIVKVPDDDENGTMAVRLENQFNREVTFLSRLHHPNVIKFIAACRKPPVFCIITEYLSEGCLRSYLNKPENKSLSLPKIVGMALEIAKGMEFIHSQGVIHRDLKPENILIDQEFHMKIADFGSACEESYREALDDDPGTYRWMAPEMIKRKPYGRKVDVYSFGLMLREMVAGSIPFVEMTPVQAAYAVVNKNLRPVIPTDCPQAMRVLIEQCWSSQPEKRPEFSQVVKVLEQFESSLACDGTLGPAQIQMCQDFYKKGRTNNWIQKFGNVNDNRSISPKPRFA